MKKKKKKESSFIEKNKLILLLLLMFFIFLGIFIPKINSPFNKSLIADRKYLDKLPRHAAEELRKSTPSATFRVPILIYHYVEYVRDSGDTIRKSLDIIPFIFENQVKTLKDAGYSFITPSDIADILDGKMILPEKPVILSFDDGHPDFYTDVLPILKKYNARAVAYIIPGFLNKLDFMYTWQIENIATMSSMVEIGAHTVHHSYLKGLPKEVAKYEIDESKKMLEDLIHAPVVSFAYPYGAFDAQAEELVSEAGFKTAVTTVPGIEVGAQNRFFIFRIRPGARMGDELLKYLDQSSFRAY